MENLTAKQMAEMPARPSKTDWKEYVAKSNGQSFFLPEEFMKEFKQIEKERKELAKMMNEAAEKEIMLRVANENLFLKVRKHLDKNGIKDNWSKNIDFNAAAYDDGEYILNIVEPLQR